MSEVYDLLVVGSGSAGLCAALWLARYGLRCKILEKRDGPLQLGQADGVQCRTVEIFESLGLSHLLLDESYHVLETTFWAADENATDEKRPIKRTGRTADTKPGLSHQPHVIMNQARINGLMLEDMKRSNGQEVDYGYNVKSVELENEVVKVVAEKNGQEEVFRAKYLLGSDGAHSVVRRTLGIKMEGDSTDAVWGVMDMHPQTTFPDIRKKTSIRSDAGTLMIIPREGTSLARFYIELPHGVKPKEVTRQDLENKAKAILYPYEVDFVDCVWWSAYAIGQRLASSMVEGGRIFLAGDACHTHSPKAGQGMNTSLQDGYNFGWKLASVLTGRAPESLLETYVSERKQTAAKLIEFDRYFSRLFASEPKSGKKATPAEFQQGFIMAGQFTAGMATHYKDSIITTNHTSSQYLAKNTVVGMRFPSGQVVRFADSKSLQLQSVCKSDGRWRIFVFGGDIKANGKEHVLQIVNTIGDYLASEESPIHTFTDTGANLDSLIETMVVLKGDRNQVEFEDFNDYFYPPSGKFKIRDSLKIFFDDESFDNGCGNAYEKYGIDPEVGCMVIVRPDQYVSAVYGLQECHKIAPFFSAFMTQKR